MTTILPFRAKEPASTTRYIYRCAGCQSTEFKLLKGGEIECADCEATLIDLRHFDPAEPEPAA